MTVGWSTYAQSLTDRPVKGMLTGPVTSRHLARDQDLVDHLADELPAGHRPGLTGRAAERRAMQHASRRLPPKHIRLSATENQVGPLRPSYQLDRPRGPAKLRGPAGRCSCPIVRRETAHAPKNRTPGHDYRWPGSGCPCCRGLPPP
ncbi:hypothetical protein [Micromonospora ureilytica]|uniref:hypothetical protein n=1 Tax=Micromonospora ureilytica TaxID=709868 RepID=UPI00197C2E84